MEEVNEAMILTNLKNRFMKADIYTNIGTILVSVNPFDRAAVMHLYTMDKIAQHNNHQTGQEVEPHVFAVAHEACVARTCGCCWRLHSGVGVVAALSSVTCLTCDALSMLVCALTRYILAVATATRG